MNKIWLIIQREYWTRVRKKSFLLTTILAPLGMVLFFAVSILVAVSGQTDRKIVVIDDSGLYINKLEDKNNLYFKYADTTLAYMNEVYKNEGYDGILYIPAPKNWQTIRPEYRSDGPLGSNAKDHIARQLEKVTRNILIEKENVDKTSLEKINNIDVSLAEKIIGQEDEKEASAEVGMVMGYILGFAIYIILLVYGTMVMKGVAEEKTSKVVEIIISSVKPFQLMMGKIIGVGMVGLTQFLIWGVMIVVLQLVLVFAFADQLAELQALANDPALAGNAPDQAKIAGYVAAFQQINLVQLFFIFLFYFFGGYLLYGSLYAAIGSAAGDDVDSNNSLSFIVTIPIILSITIMTAVVRDPSSTMASFSSIFPLTSPVVMPARLGFGFDSLPELYWQLPLSMVCLVLGFTFTTWVAGRIYRTGILMQGKKITLKDMGMWLKG
jgi:ABC-2 type transport system permease protein